MKNILEKPINYIFNGRLRHISRFSVIGVINTLVDFTVFTVFNGFIGVNYTFSQVIGYSCGVINSFIFNKKWTFSDANNNKGIYKELVKFIIVNSVSLMVTLVSMKILVKDLKVNVYISKIIVTFIAQAINFLSYKLLVFNIKEVKI